MEIWKIQCKMRFEDLNLNKKLLIQKVSTRIRDICPLNTQSEQHRSGKLESMLIPVHRPRFCRGLWLAWERLALNGVKINVDGVGSPSETKNVSGNSDTCLIL